MDRKFGLIAGGAAVALALTAGCSGSGGGKSASGGATGTPTTLNLTPAGYIKAALAKASDDKTVKITGTMTAMGFSGTLDAQESFAGSPEMSMSVTGMGNSISEVLVGGVLYMKLPSGLSVGGKPWTKLDLGSGALGSSSQSVLGFTKSADPTTQLQSLLASGDVAKVGTATVDGVQTAHYHGTVDPATAFDSSQAAKNLTPAQITELKSLMKSSGISSETIDVWIATSTGLPVRVSISTATSDGAVVVDMHMSDWGKPVTITAPPASQVGDSSSLLSGLMASATPSS